MNARKQKTADELEQAEAPTSHVCVLAHVWKSDTHSVVPELAGRGVDCSPLALGGFQVEEVVVEVHIKPSLMTKKGGG